MVSVKYLQMRVQTNDLSSCSSHFPKTPKSTSSVCRGHATTRRLRRIKAGNSAKECAVPQSGREEEIAFLWGVGFIMRHTGHHY